MVSTVIMTNNDTKYGTFNKRTHIYRQTDIQGVDVPSPKEFQTIDEARDYFFPKMLQEIFNECCTNLDWALVQDDHGKNTRFKVTFDFGIRGNVPPEEEWMEQFKRRKLLVPGQPNAEGGFWMQTNYTDPDSPEHLF